MQSLFYFIKISVIILSIFKFFSYMIVASCGFLQDSDPNRYELVGLRFRHNYSVHDVRLVVREDNNKPEYFVQFRNPWGRLK